jgi:UDP-glucose:(heptosyl)LPS alpha-1,3-glucosyltransferase
MQRNHDVTIICSEAEAQPANVKLMMLPNSAFFNHNHNLRFSHDVSRLASDFDVIAGFNKLPDLDVLYCADPVSRQPQTIFQAINPRIRGYIRLDLACFGQDSKTRILLLAEPQWDLYRRTYGTDQTRVEVLPPTVERTRAIPASSQVSVRAAKREELGISAATELWLFVGSYPAAKGLDRIIAAMHLLPNVECLCVGFDLLDNKHRKLLRMARSAGVLERLRLLGQRTDIPELMAASDLLVHPSRKDVTGTVILEALINGLPIVTTEACGYARHVSRAQAGVVVSSSPFSPAEFQAALTTASDASVRASWRENGSRYAGREDIFSGLDRAALAIEEAGLAKTGAPPSNAVASQY